MSIKWNLMETLSQVSRWTREKLTDDYPKSRPPRTDSPTIVTATVETVDDWELVSLERWAASIYAQVDSLVTKQKHQERIRKGGIHLLMDEDLIRQMETRLGAFESVQYHRDGDDPVISGGSRDNPLQLMEFEEMRGLISLSVEWTEEDEKCVRDICLAIYQRGIHPTARATVWAYLLGLCPWKSSVNQLDKIQLDLKEKYLKLLNRWKNAEPQNTSKWILELIEERKHRVEKDVVRTDATSSFYSLTESDSQNSSHDIDHGSSIAIQRALETHPKWAQLRDILMTFSIYRLDVGYVQGMSDIASVIHQHVGVMDGFKDELDRESWQFWLFVHFLHPFHLQNPDIFNHSQTTLNRRLPLIYNFHSDQSGLRTRLILVLYLLRILEPQFYKKLGEMDGENGDNRSNGATSLFWLFKSLLLVFRRDITATIDNKNKKVDSEICRLWDGMLAGMHVYSCWMDVWISIALVHEYIRPVILETTRPKDSEHSGMTSPVDTFEGLLKLMSRLAGSLDPNILLKSAAKLIEKFVFIVQPPSIAILTTSTTTNNDIDSSPSYWNADERIPFTRDEMKAMDDVSVKSMINDVEISVDEALIMLNCHFSYHQSANS